MKFLLLSCFALITTCVFTQSNRSMPVFKVTEIEGDTCDISCTLSLKLQQVPFSVYKSDQYNMPTFFKFNIDAHGNVVDIMASKHTSKFLHKLVDSLLKTTNGKWISATENNIKVKSKAIILPLYYLNGQHDQGTLGKLPSIDYLTLFNTINSLFDFRDASGNPSQEDVQQKQAGSRMLAMYPFLTNYNLLDCFLVRPIYIVPDISFAM